jgi:hypothetical protein
MTTTSFTRRNVSGSSAAARARLVIGPIATMVILSGSFSRSRRRISLCPAVRDGVNIDSVSVFLSSSAIMPCSGSAESSTESNSCFHVSAGVRCGC